MGELESIYPRLGDTSREVVCDGSLFPLALWVPDHLHLIFNAVENAISQHGHWPQIEGALKDINRLLRSREMREHFRQTCLSPSERRQFDTWSRDLVDWKWQHMSALLVKLWPLWNTMRVRFSVVKMGSEKEWKDPLKCECRRCWECRTMPWGHLDFFQRCARSQEHRGHRPN